ncbi:hypothetical protein LPJ64_004938 [Coemansia asiatica]|uniref:Arb2 domain-containing protein n=1 Tax=Coemansia asiatica TaxID=1052880 RepID=A0A9W7XI70_9FUNG|nr:hypothetical protein LPJ64_004938 [Coemansia asiatica]
MFMRPKKPTPEAPVRKTLGDLGFEFDSSKEGVLREKDTGKKYEYDFFGKGKKQNGDFYQLISNVSSREVADILVNSDLLMEPIAIPDKKQPHCNIYASPGALNSDNLVAIIGGGVNFCGVWASNVLVKHGLRKGTMIEYIRESIKRGNGVLVLNPYENICAPDGKSETFNSYSGHSVDIAGSETADEHVGYVWSRIIRDSNAKKVAFVAYSTGGIAVTNLLRYDYIRFTEKVACVAFIDSMHSSFQLASGSLDWLQAAANQWVTSHEPRGSRVDSGRSGCLTMSAGNTTDCRELTPSLCMRLVLEYIDKCFACEIVAGIPETLHKERNVLEAVKVIAPTEAQMRPITPIKHDGYYGWE